MKNILEILKQIRVPSNSDSDNLHRRFNEFLQLLDLNRQVLHLISDLEEKSQGEFLFDINYINSTINDLLEHVNNIVALMIDLGGDEYRELSNRLVIISNHIQLTLSPKSSLQEDSYIRFLNEVYRKDAGSIGYKSANLGEVGNRLDIPVPVGFAVSGWAYSHFINSNNLQEEISTLIKSVNYRSFTDLEKVSKIIQSRILSSDVPPDLAKELKSAYRKATKKYPGAKLALRSSAIGEDSHRSFAGQYDSMLNVDGKDIVSEYRSIIAGKFTPRAIYYFLSHSFSESDLPMAVCCLLMVNATKSGIAYSKDPVNPNSDEILVHSTYGLGENLMKGEINPDTFRVSKLSGEINKRHIEIKEKQLLCDPSGGIIEESVPDEERNQQSISDEQVRTISDFANRIEEHYGEPQDIEWAVDTEGRVCVLQTRSLQVLDSQAVQNEIETEDYKIHASGGEVICPGAFAGKIFHLNNFKDDAKELPKGAVVATKHSTPKLITLLDKIGGLITETGGIATHLATIAREQRLPMVTGLKVPDDVKNGTPVTLDASSCILYDGEHAELEEARKIENIFQDLNVFKTLREVLEHISPLSLVDPTSPDFIAENCTTLHDITRFSHQRSIEELFHAVNKSMEKSWSGCYLQTEYPVKVNLILLDSPSSSTKKKQTISEFKIPSDPMQAFWNGVRQKGWQSPTSRKSPKLTNGLKKFRTRGKRMDKYSETSFAVLTSDYMLLSLRLGFHFMTIEALITDEPSKNIIKLHHKGGGATRKRRIYRIRLFSEILDAMGFEHTSKGDVLDTHCTFLAKDEMLSRLQKLGSLTMMTKQLDMALSNDQITDWYINDFKRQLEIE